MRSRHTLSTPSTDSLSKVRTFLSSQLRNYGYLHLMVLFYIGIFSINTLLRHYSFGSSAWDLGIFNQAFYTTVKHGKLFYYTAELYANPGGTIFGVHFSPILFLIIPVYALLPTPGTLVVAQTIIIAFGAYPTFLLANRILKSKATSLLFSLMYLMYPHVHSVNIFDFHSEAFFITFALFSIYYFVTEKWSRYFLFLALTFFTKEFASTSFLILGLVSLWSKRKEIVISLRERKLPNKRILIPVATVALAVLWYFVAKTFTLIFNPSPNPGFVQGEPWRILGGNLLDFSILGSIPQLDFLRALKFEWDAKLYFLFTILGPLAFLPAIKLSLFLPTLVWFLLAFLSNYPPYYHLGYQYSAYIVPFSIVAAIQGVNNLRLTFNVTEKMLTKLMKKLVLVGLLCALALSLMRLPLTDLKLIGPSNHDRNIYKALELIPTKASTLTQYDIFPHLSCNLESFVVPPPFGAFKRSYYYSYVQSLIDRDTDYIIIDVNPDTRTFGLDFTYLMVFKELNRKGNYGLYASIDGVLIYKLDYHGEPTIFKSFTLLQKYYETPITGDGTVFKHPLPEGVYNITFRIYSDSKSSDLLFTIAVSQDTEVLVRRDVYGQEVVTDQAYQPFSLLLSVLDPTEEFEFKMVNLTRLSNIYLDSLEIGQISYSSS